MSAHANVFPPLRVSDPRAFGRVAVLMGGSSADTWVLATDGVRGTRRRRRPREAVAGVPQGLLGEEKGEAEMGWELLEDLPENLAFPECEYREQIAWAREAVRSKLGPTRTVK